MKKQLQKAYGYIRCSTSEQVESGLGLDVQESQIKKHCKEKHINLIKVFSDPGHSGADADRPGLQQLIDQAKEKQISLILIAHSSRLARDSMLSEIIYRDLKKHNISLISVAQPNYYEEEGDFQRKLMRTILDAFDEYEKSLISWRLKNGRAKRVELGGWHGGSIFGYDSDQKGILKINQQEAEVIKNIYYMKRYKKMSACSIAKTLNEEKIPTKRKNTRWHSLTVRKILKNSLYRGLMQYKGQIYKGGYKPIL